MNGEKFDSTLQLPSALGSNLSLSVHCVGFLVASLPSPFTLITLTKTYMDKTDRMVLFLFISALESHTSLHNFFRRTYLMYLTIFSVLRECIYRGMPNVN